MIGGALQMQMLAGAAGKNKEALEAAGKVSKRFSMFSELMNINIYVLFPGRYFLGNR